MENKEQNIASLQSLVLDLPPSCIEFCPAHPDYFVIGTYNLQKEEPEEDQNSNASVEAGGDEIIKKPQSRNGSLVVFRLTEDINYLLHVQTVSYPSALLDLHFHPHQNKHDVLAAVSSTGTLSFFRLSPHQTHSAPLVELVTHKPLGDDESVLFLSCAWHPTLPDLIAITTSDYQVHILRVDDSWSAHQTSSTPVIMHTLEAWTVAFSPNLMDPQIATNDVESKTLQVFTLYSGGDDSKLLSTTCFYDRKQGGSNDKTEADEDDITVPYPTITAKGHTAGVTAILPLSLTLLDGSQIVVTGSYDDCLRVYSIHPQIGGVMLRSPKLLAEENLDGGVWRLKLVKLEQTGSEDTTAQKNWSALILASCMHAGSRIIKITGNYSDSCQVRVLGRFEEHKSMNYGSDFCPGSELEGRSLRCVSTSFYDKLVCLWEF